MRDGEACPCLLQELALVPATCQAQETNLLSTDQLGFGGDLEANNSGTGLLRCHPITAALGLFFFFFFLGGGDEIVFFDSRG
jgi:hypothetical protein